MYVRARVCVRARVLSFQGPLLYLITFHIPHQHEISFQLVQIKDRS